jgi:hypothetical protein
MTHHNLSLHCAQQCIELDLFRLSFVYVSQWDCYKIRALVTLLSVSPSTQKPHVQRALSEYNLLAESSQHYKFHTLRTIAMHAATPLKRTTRLTARTQFLLPPPSCVQKRCSPRLTRSRTIRHVVDIKDFAAQGRMRFTPSGVIPNTKPSKQKQIVDLVDDHASDSVCDSDTEMSDELCDLSGNNIEYTSADQLDRRISYDSRFESGNEDYDLDGFVVDDSEDTNVSEVGVRSRP